MLCLCWVSPFLWLLDVFLVGVIIEGVGFSIRFVYVFGFVVLLLFFGVY